jgi:hypothetical protein
MTCQRIVSDGRGSTLRSLFRRRPLPLLGKQESESVSFRLRTPRGRGWLCGKSYSGQAPPGPDVYGIDVIWAGILNEYFIDLKPYFANEISLQFPEIAASYTVDKKLVAMPYRADVGLLFWDLYI